MTGEQVGAFVVLVDGMIFSWSAKLGREFTPQRVLLHHSNYLPTGIPSVIETATLPSFDAFDSWARQWPIHPDAPGFAPYEARQ